MTDIRSALQRGVLTPSALTSVLGVSAPTLSRRVSETKGDVVRIGRTHRVKYGLRRTVSALNAFDWSPYRISPEGEPMPTGTLVTLVADEMAWLPSDEVYVGLPPEVDDMKPQGFLGHGFPRQHPDLGLPPRLSDWSNDHILTAMVRRGEDAPGNLLVGDEALERWHGQPRVAVERSEYTTLAEQVVAGHTVGSSAGGEQPKFGVLVDGRHVLVKFAHRGTPTGRRWGDLLVMEHLALETLRDEGVPAAATQLHDASEFRFLEVERFDRVGARGRRAVLSLFAAWQSPEKQWCRCAREMREAGALSGEDARTVALLDAYGQLIGNTDRHHYNLVLFPKHDRHGIGIIGYELAPAFDQLPMMFAPTPGGVLRTPGLIAAHPTAEVWDVWDDATRLARAFWSRAAADGRLAEQLEHACTEAVHALG